MGIINCMFQRTTYEVSEVSQLASDVQVVLSNNLREQYNGKLYKNLLETFLCLIIKLSTFWKI